MFEKSSPGLVLFNLESTYQSFLFLYLTLVSIYSVVVKFSSITHTHTLSLTRKNTHTLTRAHTHTLTHSHIHLK